MGRERKGWGEKEKDGERKKRMGRKKISGCKTFHASSYPIGNTFSPSSPKLKSPIMKLSFPTTKIL
jgi:hypothetical protein